MNFNVSLDLISLKQKQLAALLQILMKSLATLNKQSITAGINSQDKQYATTETSSTLADICAFLNTHYSFQLDDTSDETTPLSSSESTRQRLSECVAYLLRKNNEKIFIRLKPDLASGGGEQSEQTFKLNSSYICKKLMQQQQQQQRQVKEQMSKSNTATNGNHAMDVKSPEATTGVVKGEASANTTPTKKESSKTICSEIKQLRTPPKKVASNSLSAADLDEETVCYFCWG